MVQTLGQLARSGEELFTGPFPREAVLLHRLVWNEHYHTAYTMLDTDEGARTNWYYLRVVQANGQMAWSSPIWVDGKPHGQRTQSRRPEARIASATLWMKQ